MNDDEQQQRQLAIDFTSTRDELCCLIAGLRNVRLSTWTPGRVNGVVEFLQRLVLLARDLCDPERPVVDAQVIAIAARISGRRTVGERTVRNWRADCQEAGFISVEFTSHNYGGHNWNRYTLELAAIKSAVYHPISGGSGRQRAATISAPGAATISAPGAATISAPGAATISALTTVTEEGRDSRSVPGPGPEPVAVAGDFGLGEAISYAPALASAAERPVESLPASYLKRGGAFASLDAATIRDPSRVVEWFRRQLDLPRPVLGATEADLILALAAAFYARNVPGKDVRTNRTAIFVNVISQRRWTRTLPYLDKAAQLLREFRDVWPMVGKAAPGPLHEQVAGAQRHSLESA